MQVSSIIWFLGFLFLTPLEHINSVVDFAEDANGDFALHHPTALATAAAADEETPNTWTKATPTDKPLVSVNYYSLLCGREELYVDSHGEVERRGKNNH